MGEVFSCEGKPERRKWGTVNLWCVVGGGDVSVWSLASRSVMLTTGKSMQLMEESHISPYTSHMKERFLFDPLPPRVSMSLFDLFLPPCERSFVHLFLPTLAVTFLIPNPNSRLTAWSASLFLVHVASDLTVDLSTLPIPFYKSRRDSPAKAYYRGYPPRQLSSKKEDKVRPLD